jgi:predicted methyltransferase
MQIPAKHKLDQQIRRLSAATMFAIAVSVGLYFGLSRGQSLAAALQQPDPALAAIIDGPQRSTANKARDRYRHPLEVLTFFGVEADSNVVEVVPGKAGYWVEILAPYLKDRGHYTASGDAGRDVAPLKARIGENPGLYGKTTTTEFTGGDQEIAPENSADFVLTFRNIHNWMRAGTADAAFHAFYRALKPGGILGVEEHRGRPDQPQDPAGQKRLCKAGLCDRARRRSRIEIDRLVRGQRQSQGHQGLSRRCMDLAADLPSEGPG